MGLTETGTLEQRAEGVRERAPWGKRAVAEGTAWAKALGQEHAAERGVNE